MRWRRKSPTIRDRARKKEPSIAAQSSTFGWKRGRQIRSPASIIETSPACPSRVLMISSIDTSLSQIVFNVSTVAHLIERAKNVSLSAQSLPNSSAGGNRSWTACNSDS
jgi:hypothetical protein